MDSLPVVLDHVIQNISNLSTWEWGWSYLVRASFSSFCDFYRFHRSPKCYLGLDLGDIDELNRCLKKLGGKLILERSTVAMVGCTDNGQRQCLKKDQQLPWSYRENVIIVIYCSFITYSSSSITFSPPLCLLSLHLSDAVLMGERWELDEVFHRGLQDQATISDTL